MLLAIDAGNTNIVFAVYDGDARIQSWRCKTDAARTADEYAALLMQLLPAANLTFKHIREAIIASVVPEANFHLRRLCEQYFHCPVQVVGSDPLDLDIAIDLLKPEEIGADRIVNAVAVKQCYRAPAIVVDFGTATTFDVIDGNNTYRGGAIAPGVNLSMNALHSAAAKLPRIGIKRPQSVIGNDTVSAMQSGIYWGYIGLIEGMIQRIGVEMEGKPFVIATGGLAPLFASGTTLIETTDEDLTLKGLVHIHKANARKQAA